MVRFLVTGSMLGPAVLVEDGVGWVAGVPDRERARAAAEERVVTILAAQLRAVLKVRDETGLQSGADVVMLAVVVRVVLVELQGWPVLDELLTGVVGWCCVKSAVTPVWCAALLHVGIAAGQRLSVGVPWGCPPTSSLEHSAACLCPTT